MFVVVCSSLCAWLGMGAAAGEWLCSDTDQTDLCSTSPKTGTTLLAAFPIVLRDKKSLQRRKYNREQLHLVTAKISAQKPVLCVKMNNQP